MVCVREVHKEDHIKSAFYYPPFEVSQCDKSWSKLDAKANIPCMLSTLLTSQFNAWLKLDATINIKSMLVTFDVSHSFSYGTEEGLCEISP